MSARFDEKIGQHVLAVNAKLLTQVIIGDNFTIGVNIVVVSNIIWFGRRHDLGSITLSSSVLLVFFRRLLNLFLCF